MSWANQVIPTTIGTWASKTSVEGLVDQRTGKPIVPGGSSITPPGAPLNVILTAMAGAVSAAFSPPASDGGSPVLLYTVTLSTGQVGVGATSPIIIAAPASIAVTATAKATNIAGQGPASAVSNSVTPSGVVTDVMRFATTNNHIMTGVSTTPAGRTELIFREPYTVGSGDLDSITFGWINWQSSNPDGNTTAPVTINFLALENDAATEHYEFGMANGVALPAVIASGANDTRTATITPQMMGRATGAKFIRGETLWLQCRGTTAAGGSLPIMVDRFGGSISAKQLFALYDPSLITPSSTSQVGKPTATLVAGGGATTFPITSGGFVPFALGTFVQAYPARPPVLVGYGDSNLFGFKDSATTLPHGKGELARAATGDGTAGQLLAAGNFSVTGITIQGLNTDKALYWSKFGDVIVDEVLGNSFGSDGTVDQTLVRGYKQAIWDKYSLNNPAAPVLSTGVGPHTTGAWTLADQTDQTIQPGYVDAGNVETFRIWHKSKEGVPGAYTKYLEFVAWRNGPSALKWPGTGVANENTDDGVHGTTKIVTLKAAELRAAIFAL